MSQILRLTAYNADGAKVKDVTGEFLQAPEFYAHQLLHIDGVVAAEILDADSNSLLRRTDPGLVFEDVVQP